MSETSLQPNLTLNVRSKNGENIIDPRDRAVACGGFSIFYLL